MNPRTKYQASVPAKSTKHNARNRINNILAAGRRQKEGNGLAFARLNLLRNSKKMATSMLASGLSPGALEKAKTELNEVPEEIDGAIKELRCNIRAAEETGETKGLELIRLDDDAFLLRFLRAKKYRQKDATKQYLNYCKYRTKLPEVFEGLCLEKVRDVFEKQAVGVLESRSKNGCRVLLFFPGRLDVDEDPIRSMDDAVGAMYLILEKLLEDPETQVHGLHLIEDWEGIGFAQVIRFQFIVRREMGKFLEIFQVLTITSSTFLRIICTLQVPW